MQFLLSCNCYISHSRRVDTTDSEERTETTSTTVCLYINTLLNIRAHKIYKMKNKERKKLLASQKN